MNKYRIIKQLGDGSFGTVLAADNLETNEKSLKKINNHKNIIRLKEVIRENDELHFVFEFADGNLYQKSKERNGVPFPLQDVKRYTYRAPEVLLRSTTYSSPIDIWAVGAIIAELFNLKPLFPGSSEIDEIHRISSVCGPPLADMGDMNTTQKPHISTASSQRGGFHVAYYNSTAIANRPGRDMLFAGGIWPEGLRLASQMGFKFPPGSAVPIAQLIPTAPDDAIQLVADMLIYDPHKRPTASEALRHPWFAELAKDSSSPLAEESNHFGLHGVEDKKPVAEEPKYHKIPSFKHEHENGYKYEDKAALDLENQILNTKGQHHVHIDHTKAYSYPPIHEVSLHRESKTLSESKHLHNTSSQNLQNIGYKQHTVLPQLRKSVTHEHSEGRLSNAASNPYHNYDQTAPARKKSIGGGQIIEAKHAKSPLPKKTFFTDFFKRDSSSHRNTELRVQGHSF
ncbi:hypothetical protein HDV04_002869 [Boothiomyces sp. JEL0838]|nr:hypothetical protein HDV04_002869 [Boothiomyces sp. JEL0838]